jgi:hypothetical protein
MGGDLWRASFRARLISRHAIACNSASASLALPVAIKMDLQGALEDQPYRNHPGLGKDPRLPYRGQSGSVERPPRHDPAQAEQDCQSGPLRGHGLPPDQPLHGRTAKQEGMGARALDFAILTAARSGEVRGATWKEFDLKQRLWTIPSNRMKVGKEHRIPLSQAAINLLDALPRFAGPDYVFPGTKGGQLSDMALTTVLRRMGMTVTAHGFRSTFRDWAAECTNFPNHVVEMALAHILENKVEEAYRREDLFEKRKKLMQAWAAIAMSYPSKPTSLYVSETALKKLPTPTLHLFSSLP